MFKKIELRGFLNTFFFLVLLFIGLMLIYTLLRLGFYYFNKDMFPQVDSASLWTMMVGGLKFDTVAILYINILLILLLALPIPFKYGKSYQNLCTWIFVIANGIGIALNLIDYAYYPFTLKRTTGTVFSQFSNEENLGKLIIDFLFGYWYLVLLFVGLVILLVKFYALFKLPKPQKIGWLFFVTQMLSFLFLIFLFIGGARGGWAHSTRPITLSNAGDYVKNPEEMNIVLNTPFSMLKTLKAIALKEVEYFTPGELDKIYPVVHQPKDTAAFRKLNVVVLILESFAKEHIGALNRDIPNYKGYTPFLDSLIGESYTFTRSYANGRKSIDALPSVITGIPSVGEPFVLSIYSGNKTTSLANLLADEGYETAFFHGAPNGSMGFSAYTQLAGIKHYFGKNEYNNDADFDGIWGIWDEPFMQFMADEINQMPQPFFTGFFSLSSHHPFKVPEKYTGQFPKGPLEVHEPVGYTDYALKQFFAKASKMHWYNNTLFVICADHATVSHLPEYKTLPNSFAIPIIFYHPAGNLKGISDRLVQQIDILPTVLNYLNYPKPYFSFGFDALAADKNNFVVNNIGGVYNVFQGDYFMTHDGEKITSLYNLKTDKFLKSDIRNSSAIRDSLETSLKAFIQRYNFSMIHNELSVND